MSNFPITKDAFPYILVFAVLAIFFYRYISPWLSLLPLIFLVFVAFFFRNPSRKIPQIEGIAVSPADGVVMTVDTVYEPHFFKTKVTRVSIFLSIFNVHINRSPIAGEVIFRSHYPGKFLPAFKSHASELNEKNMLVIDNGKQKVMVSQITGFIARRIVCWSEVGNHLDLGTPFGLIKFGSCTEVFFEKDLWDIQVKKGDKVIGGETIIGRLENGAKNYS